MSIEERRLPEDFLPLRPVEFHVLLSLAKGERHGWGIIKDAEARGEARVPDIGTLYRALARMSQRELIRSSEGPPEAEGGDERRQYYAITPFGLEVARLEARRLASLTRAAMDGLLLPEGRI